MGFFKSMHDLNKQAKEMERNSPPAGARLAAMQERMADLNQMMATTTQAANNAAAAAAAGASGFAERCPVMIVGMRQVGSVNFDLLVEFDLTVTPEGRPPYPATIQQLVSQFQVGQLSSGRTLQATVDPSNPMAIWLDFGSAVMTVGKISGLCWTVFGVMCLGFLPLAIGIMHIHAIPTGPRLALMLVVVIIAWWGPFGYAMYLALAVMRNGDRRTLRRGIRGTAEVLTAKATNTVIQEGEFAWQAPRVYKYRLRVTLPGRRPVRDQLLHLRLGHPPGLGGRRRGRPA